MTPTKTHQNDPPRMWRKDGWRKHPLLPGGWKTGGSPCIMNYCEYQLCGKTSRFRGANKGHKVEQSQERESGL